MEDVALVGKPLADFEVEEEDEEDSSGSSSDSSSSSSSSSSDEEDLKKMDIQHKNKVLATPAVRRIAMENKLDLNTVKASGKQGRVLKGDVLEHLNLIPADTMKPHPTLLPRTPPVGPAKPLPADRIEVLKGVRKVMYRSMTESLVIYF